MRAFHYLLKPVSPDKIGGVLDEAADTVQKRINDAIFVHTKDGEYYIDRTEICCIVFENRAIAFVCTEKILRSLSIQESFKNATAGFDADSRFFRCGAGVIVNLSRIRSIEKNKITFANNSEFAVPRASSKELYHAWLDYYLD